ncbi:hypothetical protein Pint_07961 [Pistacia integerrima]|uniref:Uncharacterized protein n=1 Tax=Pistacia integerrima TaxID=434235 RepID=A0ACC0XWB4_9ROSI|nr:hypothetical protein Pint_07961 [Pistacia integerrima]
MFWLVFLLVGNTQGSRHSSQVFKVSPTKSHNSPRTISGFFPKGVPIPPSGPSKKHNDIGLESSDRLP